MNDTEMYEAETEEAYDGGGWPGDGSGTDDLADFNANEADDYGPDEDCGSDDDDSIYGDDGDDYHAE